MGAPPLDLHKTLDELSVLGPLTVAHQGQTVHLRTPDGVELWVRTPPLVVGGVTMPHIYEYRGLQTLETRTPKQLVEAAVERATKPAKVTGVVHLRVSRGAAVNPSCTPIEFKPEDGWTGNPQEVTCPDCRAMGPEPLPSSAPVPLLRTRGHLGLVDLAALGGASRQPPRPQPSTLVEPDGECHVEEEPTP